MDNEELQTENDELRERLSDTTSIIIKVIKEELEGLPTTNPNRGFLGKCLRYYRTKQMRD